MNLISSHSPLKHSSRQTWCACQQAVILFVQATGTISVAATTWCITIHVFIFPGVPFYYESLSGSPILQ